MTPPSVAILGAGMMGTAIAAAHLRCGAPVLLYDNSVESVQKAPQRVAEELRLQDTVFDPSLVFCTNKLDDVFSCDILIETITEKLKAKQKLYRTLSSECDFGKSTILLTNTSTISISKLAEGLSDEFRCRFCGFHVFHPVRKNSLLEIIPGVDTASEIVDAARLHAQKIDKRPITVKDGPGFLVNRLLNPYLSSALSLFEEGVSMQRIERIATEFGMRMGPFRIMDEIGLDVVMHAGWVLYKAFPDRVPQSQTLLLLVERGRLGRKTGRGFMIYPNNNSWDGDGVPDETLCVTVFEEKYSDEEIVRKLFVSMYEESVHCLEDGIIDDLSVADVASVHALGFPSEKGGIVTWHSHFADTPALITSASR